MAKYNRKYNQLVRWLYANISGAEKRAINKELEKAKYKNKPAEMYKRLDKFFMEEIWDKKADKTPSRGNPKTQRENMKSFEEKWLLSLNKLKFEPIPGMRYDEEIDFSPIFAKYREAKRTYVEPTKIKEISPKVKKFSTILRPPKRKQIINDLKEEISSRGKRESPLYIDKIKVTPENADKFSTRKLKSLWEEQVETKKKVRKDVLYTQIDNTINNLAKFKDARSINSLQELKKILRDLHYRKKRKQKLTTYQAKELYEKIDKILEPYKRKEYGFQAKSDKELKRALELEGVSKKEINKLKTKDQLKKAAKKQGIGLRKYQKTRNELIDAILKARPGYYRKEELEKSSLPDLKDTYKLEKKEVRELKDPKIDLDDLPGLREKIIQEYGEKGKKITQKDINKVRDRLLKVTPFLNQEEWTEAINRGLAARLEDKPVIDRKMEQRYMESVYGDPTMTPTFEDLKDLSQFTNKDFRYALAKKIVKKKDPVTGKERLRPETLKIEEWRNYRNKLRDKISKIEAIKEENNRLLKKEARAIMLGEQKKLLSGVKEMTAKQLADEITDFIEYF
jgi:hypothetical protein